MQKLVPIMKLQASYHARPWGGKRLGHPPSPGIGEAWEVSLLQEGPSIYSGEAITTLASDHQIPYLIKFLDTSEYLSVQVHPDDAYAKKVARSKGKTECWAVVKAGEEAGIFLGTKKGVTQQQFFQVIEQKSDPSNMMNYYPVQVGDFFFVPAGSLHAVGKNITLIEIQQSCGLTYRVWDWNRGRELHVNHARAVICFEDKKNTLSYFQHKKNIFAGGVTSLASHRDFKASSFSLQKGGAFELDDNSKRFSSITVADGCLEITRQGTCEAIGPYESALLPSGFGPASLRSLHECFGVIVE